MSGTIEPPCGVPAHRMGRWEDVVLGIWWCPDCGEETWATEGVDDERDSARAIPSAAPGGSGTAEAARPRAGADGNGTAVPDVRAGAAEPGPAAGAPGDRAPDDGVGWRDRPGGQRLWRLIWEAFGRAAS